MSDLIISKVHCPSVFEVVFSIIPFDWTVITTSDRTVIVSFNSTVSPDKITVNVFHYLMLFKVSFNTSRIFSRLVFTGFSRFLKFVSCSFLFTTNHYIITSWNFVVEKFIVYSSSNIYVSCCRLSYSTLNIYLFSLPFFHLPFNHSFYKFIYFV